MNSEDVFDSIADRYRDDADVTAGTGFGNKPGLRVRGRIFAMLIDHRLVLKLPASRCLELCADPRIEPFDAGKGRPMKEWIMVHAALEPRWAELVAEAHAFVGGVDAITRADDDRRLMSKFGPPHSSSL